MKACIDILYGPTASGKSAGALKNAAQKNSVIINADAMQCYDALHTLTAQPNAEEQLQAPHKLYGCIPPAENIIVTKWRDLALKEIYAALENNQNPILVGGTGFYIKALTEGLSPIPDIPDDLRVEANEIHKTQGLYTLLQDLRDYDADALEGLDTDNSRRIIRAWEVLKHTGRSIQEWQHEPREGKPDDLEFNLTLITRPRSDLIERINTRFDHMMAGGILEEVRDLSDQVDAGHIAPDNLILKAHGFRPLRAYLKNEISLEDATQQSKAETRQYAKRQMTWARHQFGLDT